MRMMRRKGIISRVLGKPFSFLLIATAAIAALVAFAVGPTEIPTLHAQSIPTDPLNGCPVPSATFAGWFETGVPAQDGVVKPADSTMFPGNPNCDFYFWSKQMFLWLTSPAPSRYGGGTRIFNSPTFFDVTPLENGSRSFSKHEPGIIRFFRVRIAKPGPNGLPVIFDKRHRMFEVALPKRGPGGNPVILNRLNKEVEVTRITVSPTKRVTFFDNAGRRIVGAKPLPVRPAPIEVPQAKELPKNKAAAQKAALMRKIPTAQLFMFNRRPIFIDALGNPIDPEEGQATTNAVLMAQNQSL